MTKQLKTLLYGSNMWYLGEGMFGPLLAVFAERLGGDILDISWAWATFLIVSGIMTILVGKLADSYSKEAIMTVGYALNALMTFAYLFVSTPAELFAVQAGLGVASALSTPTWDALFDKYSGDGEKDGSLWGLAEGLPDLVTGTAIIIGGLLLTYTSFTVLFVVMGSIQVIATLIQARIMFQGR
jgi:MFS family permease